MIFDNVYETMDLAGGEKTLRSDKLVKVAGYLAPSKEKQVHMDEMTEMCFLLSSDKRRHSLLLKQMRYGYNMGRDEYPVTTTLVLDLLIRTEGGIQGNQKSPT